MTEDLYVTTALVRLRNAALAYAEASDRVEVVKTGEASEVWCRANLEMRSAALAFANATRSAVRRRGEEA